MRNLFTSVLLLIIPVISFSQQLKVSGTVFDETSNVSLPGAHVIADSGKYVTSTFIDGSYSLYMPKGKHEIEISFLGYESQHISIQLKKDTVISLKLRETAFMQEEVQVVAHSQKQDISSTELGLTTLTQKSFYLAPVLMGEADPLKSIEQIPGVMSSEAGQGLNVRGGSWDQNLVLYDNATVFNASHLFGFYSVFNSASIDRVDFYKSGIPSRFGGRMSSVISVESAVPNMTEISGDISVGVLSSRVTVSAPIIKNKWSMSLSARRTYINEWIKLAQKKVFNDNEYKSQTLYFFEDYNLSSTYNINSKNIFHASAYVGRDVFNLKNNVNGMKNNIEWGNVLGSIQYKHIFNDSLFMKMSASYSQYNFEFMANQNVFNFSIATGVRNYRFRTDMSQYTKKITLRYGIDFQQMTYLPSDLTGKISETKLELGDAIQLHAVEMALYGESLFQITPKLALNAGLRLVNFMHLGEYIEIRKNAEKASVDTIHYKRNQIVKSFLAPEPRVQLRYLISKNSSVKTSVGINNQNSHLVAIASAALPADFWLPSSNNVMPQKSYQATAGYFYNFPSSMYESSVNVYYKKYKDLIHLESGLLNMYFGGSINDRLMRGDGYAYGAEFSIAKVQGNFTGRINYVHSKSMKVFKDLNEGNEFPSKYDRPHDLQIIAGYKLNKKITLSSMFILRSGENFTMPVGRYIIQGNIVNIYDELNGFRMPMYHRLDISMDYKLKCKAGKESILNVSIYNVYNRQNPFYLYFEAVTDLESYSLDVKARQVSLFPILPSVSWRYSF